MNIIVIPGGGRCRRPGKIRRLGWLAGLFTVGGILTTTQAAPPQGGNFKPDNVFAYPAKLSLDLRRVAVLPLAFANDHGDLPEGCSALSPVLLEQIVKTKRFEAVTVDADNLRRGTGRASWTAGETLPTDLLGFLRREYGCDGVLFAELTAYHAYAPMAVGWRLKLADVRSGQVIWAVDELFDAANPSIYDAAQRFASKKSPNYLCHFGHGEDWLAANSPRRFGAYSVATLLETLPER